MVEKTKVCLKLAACYELYNDCGAQERCAGVWKWNDKITRQREQHIKSNVKQKVKYGRCVSQSTVHQNSTQKRVTHNIIVTNKFRFIDRLF